RLADELGEAARAQRPLEGELELRLRTGGDDRLAHRRAPARAGPNRARASRRSAGTSSGALSPSSTRSSSRAVAAARSGQPRPTRAATTSASGVTTPRAGLDTAGAVSLPASETVMSFAVLGPMPDTRRKGASSSS